MAKNKKKLMIKVGKHIIDPEDVAAITQVKTKGLFIVRLKSQPNMEYPIWVGKNQIEALLEYFDIKISDVPDSDHD
jgi:hypothetical protein